MLSRAGGMWTWKDQEVTWIGKTIKLSEKEEANCKHNESWAKEGYGDIFSDSLGSPGHKVLFGDRTQPLSPRTKQAIEEHTDFTLGCREVTGHIFPFQLRYWGQHCSQTSELPQHFPKDSVNFWVELCLFFQGTWQNIHEKVLGAVSPSWMAFDVRDNHSPKYN